jgi:hypothetical protein
MGMFAQLPPPEHDAAFWAWLECFGPSGGFGAGSRQLCVKKKMKKKVKKMKVFLR